MNWSATVPTTPGWYWSRTPLGRLQVVCLVSVAGEPTLAGLVAGETRFLWAEQLTGEWWTTPVPPPEPEGGR